jgi:uncharacterized Ntn-hydrolase superfamily protein
VTYSLVARDDDTGALGVVVQSHFFSVGSLVTWAEAGVGAVATQSFADPSYGPLALRLLREGATASDALAQLVEADDLRAVRQVGLVDSAGRTAAHTGARCVPDAGQRAEPGVSAQANMMERPTVWSEMVAAYEAADGPFADRLLAAVDAAEREGGDLRGRQSAALLIVSGNRSERPWEEVLVDLRVDDHPDPVGELRRLVDHQRAFTLIGEALFTPGAVIGEFTLGDERVERVAQDLARAQAILGDNPEPTVWRGVLFARAGRPEAARREFELAAERNPRLREFVRRLARAELVPANREGGG